MTKTLEMEDEEDGGGQRGEFRSCEDCVALNTVMVL